MKKNLSVLFVVMLVASMVLSACGGSAPAATKAPVKEPAATKAPAATEAPAADTEAPAAASASWLENTVNNMPDHRAPTDEEMAVMDGDFQAVAQALGLSGSGTTYSSMAPAGTSSETVYQYFSDQSKATSFDSSTMTPDGGSAESAIHYAVFPNPDGGNFVIVVTPLTTGVGIKALAFEGDVSAPAATEAPAAADWVSVTDKLGAIEVTVPGAWSAYNGDVYEVDGYKFATISVSSNLDDMYKYAAPGVDIMSNTGMGGYVQFLDYFSESFVNNQGCTVGERLNYTDSRYTGKLDELRNCSNSGNYIMIVSASPTDNPPAHVVVVIYYSPADESTDAAMTNINAILSTFNVVGTLP